MEKLVYQNIFDAITDDAGEAAELEFRADMMLLLRQLFEAKKLNQAEIGTVLGIPQPRVSELMCGKIDTVSSDKVISYLSKLGYRLKPTYHPAPRSKRAPIRCDVMVREIAA